ncbi:competence protein ComEC [Chitinophaga polysaccharea]|uniref:Competence protein ComEC n=1 Tax=Chitinophaga polysaccharea TaxID=1293035 RepID=A0A561Q290_9BACT|nr:ComEC/Rec2 family competence protein [Chitinophaga polysaccharea]TWF44485.1 competence protein ComEC [Chitinophaga polysaccharea]
MHFESTAFTVMCWKPAPFLRLIFPFLAGISIQLYTELPPLLLLCTVTVCACCAWLFRYLPVQWRFKQAWLPGMLLQVSMAGGGALLLYKADIRHQQGFFQDIRTDTSLVLLQIEEPLQPKAKSFKSTARVIALYVQYRWMPAKGNLLLYIARDTMRPLLVYGDRLVVRKKPELIRSNGNPGGFNYQQYCVSQQLYQQLYLQAADYYKLSRMGGSSVNRWLLHARDYCLSCFRRYIGAGPEAGMAEALLIGYRQDLDKAVVQDYSNTGIVHIIAISGMHLALLYGTLLWCLRWLPPGKWTGILKAILILGVLWGFALLTGASASVLRSAVMFTGITLGRFVLERYSSIYNMLAASAFLLLAYQPYLAIDAGFQLSYLAVLSILLFYQPLYELWNIKRKWMIILWQMMSVSLAAQLMTTPVSLFYFHQFPNYFLLANLMAVPLSTVIIYGEVILLGLSPFPVLATFAGLVIRFLIFAMNSCVRWLGTLPYALVTNIHCSLALTICLYVLLAGIALWWLSGWRPGALLAALSLWGCLVTRAAWLTRVQQQSKIIVYNVPAYTAVDCIYGQQARFIGDDSIWQTAGAQTLLAARNEMGIHAGVPKGFQQYQHYSCFYGRSLLIIDSTLPRKVPGRKLQADYILLTHNPRVDINKLDSLYDYQLLIFAANNYAKRISHWKQDCEATGRRYYVVGEQGAFVAELR